MTNPYKNHSWISIFYNKESLLSEFLQTTEISFSPPNLPFQIEKQIEKIFGDSILEDITSTTFPIYLLETIQQNSYSSSSVLFLVYKDTPRSLSIFAKKFFYYSLPKKILEELFLYLYCIRTIFLQKFSDFQIDLFSLHKEILSEKSLQIAPDEFLFLNEEKNSPLSLGWSFLSVVYQNFSFKKNPLSYLEKKILQEIFRKKELKSSLGLSVTDFDYLEKAPSFTEESYSSQKNKYLLFQELVHNQKLSLQEYIENTLVHKKLLIWSWWTVSPFIASDLSILIPSILEQKNIAAIYVDLCLSSQDTINQYLLHQSDDELQIQKEIKKIYPIHLHDFQKETLPYMILLEKLRMLKTPITCTGINGNDMSSIEPFINENNLLEYDTHPYWADCLQKEFLTFKKYSSNDLVIFFQFLKPMFKTPDYLLNNPLVERIIHVDKFTGFGPQKPETSLACYSRFSCENQSSFVIPNIDLSFIKDEVVLHLPCSHPQKLEQHIYMDNSKFNQFKKYNSLVYSTQSGGGGRGDQETAPKVSSPSIYQMS